eukprot:TRINITY_DN10471_c0_g1_i4.p1 TRINITY_DN10471_c0_g1~~TRINITY_DN10471_c0_g1_i4.p1  ORF type:complete len:505 (-),score=78.34 TRINITY_DN10471_c0_g1_i4:236-1750(-)
MAEELDSLEYTPTWVVALVCSIIVIISLVAERLLHRLGKLLKSNNQDALFEALQKLKEELMLLGFISLLLTVFQTLISHICMPKDLSYHMLPCKRTKNGSTSEQGSHYREYSHELKWNRRRLLSGASESNHCTKGKVPLLSIEALHHLHIFIFVLALVHVIFCAITMVLGGIKIRRWKHWEIAIRNEHEKKEKAAGITMQAHHHRTFIMERAVGYWGKSAVVSWIRSFFKQFYASVTKSDYAALRLGFIMNHCRSNPRFDFHKYMMRVLETDFKKVVGISWYLWLFVVIFLLLDVDGWHTYFWLSFLPLILLLTVGAKLEHIITRLALEVGQTGDSTVKPSDGHFWFGKPGFVLYLIHFILFQNSFEIAFFFWILFTYGFNSCIMEEAGYIATRLVVGVLIQVLCSYSTLPLYAIVTQMGSMFKGEIFDAFTHATLHGWAEEARKKKKPIWKFGRSSEKNPSNSSSIQMQKMTVEALGSAHDAPGQSIVLEEITSAIEHSREVP